MILKKKKQMSITDPAHMQIASDVFKRSKSILPDRLVSKLSARYQKKGHYINYVKYYGLRVTLPLKEGVRIRQMHEWGKTYAAILKKIAQRYKTDQLSYCFKSIENALVRYLPDHLTRLMEDYKTDDDLAGAHLGDDNFNWKTIEWNLGAVGGLEEGYTAARLLHSYAEKSNRRPVETAFLKTIRKMLMWAYEAHCKTNMIHMQTAPVIAYVEHDDIYGSSVAICRHLSDIGCNIRLCFDKELVLKNNTFLALDGEKVDILYLDCHLENLYENHPIIQALKKNTVALDGSVFSRLVLRSKVIMALLHDRIFQTDIQLTTHESQMIENHLTPTYLWQKKTFTDVFSNSKAISTLFSSLDKKSTPFAGNPAVHQHNHPIVIKESIGPVFGGTSVSVIFKKQGRYHVKEARSLIKKHIKEHILHRIEMLPGKLQAGMYHFLKTILKQIVYSRLCPLDKPFIILLKKKYDNFINPRQASHLKLIFLERFRPDLEILLSQSFNINVHELNNLEEKHYIKFWNSMNKLFVKPGCGNEEKVFSLVMAVVENFLSAIVFLRQNGQAKINGLFQTLKKLGGKQSMGFTSYSKSLINHINKFLEINNFNLLLTREKKDILDLVEKQFISQSLQMVLPIVIQEYNPPLKWHTDTDLYISNRIHVIYTKHRVNTFISGTQLFELSHLKQKNSTKMTGSLWI